MNGEAAPQESVSENSTQAAKLAKVITLDTEKKAAQKVLDEITEKLNAAKEEVKTLFIDMGVNSMKSMGKNVYLHKQIWASVEDSIDKKKVTEAMMALDMEDYISFGTQKLSSYVREIIDDHPEFKNSNGEIIATPEEIAAVLPDPFNKMFKVTEKVDIRVRK